MAIRDATAVCHGEKLYVGGWTPGNYRDSAKLYIYTPTADTWDTPIECPVYWFGLTTYHSQLVLVGGEYYVSENIYGKITDKLWTLSTDGQWQEILPPMKTKRHSVCAVSYNDHLLVAGGMTFEKRSLSIVEVFNSSNWLFAQPLPIRYYSLKSAILGQYCVLMGGKSTDEQNLNAVHYASLDSLLASCKPFSEPSSVWKRLADTPYQCSSTAVFGGRLIAIGGGEVFYPSLTTNAYSFQTNSWIHVGDMPFGVSHACSVVLPTEELMVMGGYDDWATMRNDNLKAIIKGNQHLGVVHIELYYI